LFFATGDYYLPLRTVPGKTGLFNFITVGVLITGLIGWGDYLLIFLSLTYDVVYSAVLSTTFMSSFDIFDLSLPGDVKLL